LAFPQKAAQQILVRIYFTLLLFMFIKWTYDYLPEAKILCHFPGALLVLGSGNLDDYAYRRHCG
jgi:hypothetical protein